VKKLEDWRIWHITEENSDWNSIKVIKDEIMMRKWWKERKFEKWGMLWKSINNSHEKQKAEYEDGGDIVINILIML
jgi:hypothetical protein